MDPREKSQDEEAREFEELYDDTAPDDEPLDPDDDDTLGRPVRLRS
ncbi:MAG: hypothetical protein ACREKQ_02160 [Candidatus Rokuibacteriota bacterium]